MGCAKQWGSIFGPEGVYICMVGLFVLATNRGKRNSRVRDESINSSCDSCWSPPQPKKTFLRKPFRGEL